MDTSWIGWKDCTSYHSFAAKKLCKAFPKGAVFLSILFVAIFGKIAFLTPQVPIHLMNTQSDANKGIDLNLNLENSY